MKTGRFLGVLVSSGLLASGASASLIVNGSFEQSSLNPGGSWIPLGPGSTAIDGWTTLGGGVDYMGTIWASADGIRNIDLNNTSPGGIAQSFATVPGAVYEVTFALSANMAGAPAEKVMEVHAAGSSAEFRFNYVDAGSTPADPKWSYKSWSFVATGTSTTLSFVSLSGGVFGPAIDDVVVTGIPTPGTLALLGLAGIAATRRRS